MKTGVREIDGSGNIEVEERERGRCRRRLDRVVSISRRLTKEEKVEMQDEGLIESLNYRAAVVLVCVTYVVLQY